MIILSVFGAYQMADGHAEEVAALEASLSTATGKVKLLTTSLRKKNEYIKRLETRMVDNADAPTVVNMLNNIFLQEDEDSVPEPVLPGDGATDEA
jgi:hypothetical protein